MRQYAANEDATERLGRACVGLLTPGRRVFVSGDLGAGKTTLIRGMLGGLGHRGAVTSPTYTLVETYSLSGLTVFHLDLYRIDDPDELEFIGFRDMLGEHSLCLIEWPERAVDRLPAADMTIAIEFAGQGRMVTFESRHDVDWAQYGLGEPDGSD